MGILFLAHIVQRILRIFTDSLTHWLTDSLSDPLPHPRTTHPPLSVHSYVTEVTILSSALQCAWWSRSSSASEILVSPNGTHNGTHNGASIRGPASDLTGKLTVLLSYCLTVWLSDCLTDWLSYCLTVLLSDCLIHWLTDWLTDWLTHLITDLTYLLSDWLIPTRLLVPYWLTERLTHWLDWLTYTHPSTGSKGRRWCTLFTINRSVLAQYYLSISSVLPQY